MLSVLDLFCGAGGLSLGLKRAGVVPVLALDHFPAATATYRKNLGDHVVDAEIHEGIAHPKVDVIVGGPPCQGFSSAGQRKVGDHRNTLVSVFASLIARERPKAFIFENVEGFLTAESGDRVLDLLQPLVDAGYCIHLRKVNAANFGAPQHRKRVIGIGGRGFDPGFPEATHAARGAPGATLAGRHLPATPSVLDALLGLPAPSRLAPGSPPGHFAAPLDESDLKRVCALRPGQTMRDLPENLWHQSYRRRAFRRVADGTPTENRGGAPAGIRRLIGDEPCKAITSGALTEFIHPEQDRYLTLRECARLQTFPDDFEFLGTQAEQRTLLGNAIPPVLGEALGRHIVQALRKAELDKVGGQVLSFVPTLSMGMSPALQHTQTRVLERFRSASASRPMQEGFAWD